MTHYSSFNDHKKRHLNERQFKCDYNNCSKSFYRKQNLAEHKRRHLNILI